MIAARSWGLGAVALLVACEDTSPEAIAEKYVVAREHGFAREAYALLSQRDRDVRAFHAFEQARVTPVDDRVRRLLARRTKVRVVGVEAAGPSVRVGLAIDRVDVDDSLRALIAADLESGGPAVASKLQKRRLPTRTSTETVHLTRGPAGWRVFLDLAGRDETERRQRVDRLKRLAIERMHDGHLEWARETYERVLRWAPDDAGARHAMSVLAKMTDAAARSSRRAERAAAYRPKVIVDHIKVSGRTVRGEIRNTGDRGLDEVELTITGLDPRGVPITETTAYPVKVEEASDDPGLPPRHARRFEATFEAPPADWKGAVEVTVTGLRFTP